MPGLIYKDEVYALVGAAMEVYNTLGPGFLEPVYQEALEIELAERHIPFKPQQELRIAYKGRYLRKTYVADFVVFDKIIVEIKALNRLTSREEAQLLNYLKATGMQVGVLINFGAANRLEWKRMVLTRR
ncbi:MAG: GxxExxY protein [Chloroflexi bacterium]|nr:MAG: GxxExxY protein [Chloroflexota bacterium]